MNHQPAVIGYSVLIEMDKTVTFHLVLGGSFFPLHRGHINLLKASKEYILSSRNVASFSNISVGSGFLCPSHNSSLIKKLVGQDQDDQFQQVLETRQSQMQQFLVQSEEEASISWIRIHPDLLKSERNIGFAQTVANLRDKLEAQSDENNIHKLVQVSGTDSKVQAIVRCHQKSNVNKDSDLDGLGLILVQDGRPVPEENMALLESYQHVVQLRDFNLSSPRDLLPRSSTVERFLQRDIFHIGRSFDIWSSQFKLEWLIDTKIILGKGRQGLVRLMLLGPDQVVAVKVVNLSQKKSRHRPRFKEEELIWRRLSVLSPKTIPRLFATGVTETKNEHVFGYIITELGICLQDLFPKLKSGANDQNSHEETFRPFFKQFDCLETFLKSTQDLAQVNAWLESFFNIPDDQTIDKNVLKNNIVENVLTELVPGLKTAGILHRDLKTDNLLYLKDEQRVVACDFGVGFVHPDFQDDKSKMKSGPRGALKYYPELAVDFSDSYDFWCDEYFASLSMAEVITEESIYGEDCDTSKAIEKRKNGEMPALTPGLKSDFSDVWSKLEAIWGHERLLTTKK